MTADPIVQACERRDLNTLTALVPYSRFLGMELLADGDDALMVHIPFAEHLVGNPTIPALHGGTVASVLETAAIFNAVWQPGVVGVPKTINITVDYLRPGRPEATFSRAIVTKLGRNVASVNATAWQSDPARPIATALVHLLIRTRAR